MKTILLSAFLAFAAIQFVQPPIGPASPTAPAPAQRGQPAGTAVPQPAPLNAAECKCSIEVTVKHMGTAEPISDVEVTLNAPNRAAANAAGAVRSPVTAITDNSGRVSFRDLEEGVYSITARRDGYFGSVNDTFQNQVNASVPVGPAVAQNGARANPAPGVVVVPPRQPVQQITL